jgi:WD40 repeat protein
MTTVFISYSRKDGDFVRRLNEALEARDREAWVDWEGIPPTAEWMREIVGAIDAASAFVFVMTPDSLSSAVCVEELQHAVAQNKRLVPLLRRDVEPSSVPSALARVNWILCRDADDFTAGVQTLVTAIDTDLEWVRAHTRLLVRAREWDGRGRENSLALRGDDLKAAEQWLALGPTHEPSPTELQTRYVLESRRVATNRRYALLGSVAVGLVAVAILGTTTYFGRRDAARQRTIAIAGRLTSDAELVRDQGVAVPTETGWLERSVLLAAEAASRLQSVGTRSLQTDIALRRGLALLPRRVGRFERSQGSLVNALVLSSDGRLVAASRSPLGVVSWPERGGESVVTKTMDGTQSLVLSPDGRFAATVSLRGTVDVWDTTNLAPVVSVTGFSGHPGTIAIGPGARYLVVGLSRFDEGPRVWTPLPTRVWAVAGGAARELPSLPHASSLSFSPDGAWLAGIVDKAPRVWRVTDASGPGVGPPLPPMPFEAMGVQFDANGTKLAVFLETATVKLLAVGDWESAGEFDHGVGLQAVSADGRYAALTTDAYGARVIETASGDEVVRLHADAKIEAIAFSPNGPQVAVAGLGEAVDLWQVDAGGSDILRVAAGPSVVDTGFDVEETSLLTIPSASGGIGLQRWPLGGAREAPPLVPLAAGGLAVFSADARLVAVASGRQVTIRNAADGSTIRRFDYQGNATAVALSAEGGALALATDDGAILLWSTAGGDQPVRFRVQGTIEEGFLAVGPSGARLAAVTTEPATRAGPVLVTHVWRPPNTTATRTSPVGTGRSGLVATPCGFSADARYLAVDDDAGFAIGEPETGRVVARINHPSADRVCAFSADARLLATAGTGVVRVWDVATRTETTRLEGTGRVSRLRFSPRNRYLATMAIEGDGRVWLLEPKDLIDLACARVSRNLTVDEKRDYFGDEPDRPTCPRP